MDRLGLAFALALGIVAFGGIAQADKIKDITCEQFLAMDEDSRERIAYWIHGVETASSKKSVDAAEVDIGYDQFGQPVMEIVTACQADKKASLWEKVKAKLHL